MLDGSGGSGSSMKRCTQCGLLKEATHYRLYTYSRKAGTQGRYSICRSCESINTRYRQALKVVGGKYPHVTTEQHDAALNTIAETEALYAVLENAGLRAQRAGAKVRQPKEDRHIAAINSLKKYWEDSSAHKSIPATPLEIDQVPEDLRQWLEAATQDWLDNDLSPEYLQETVYEALKSKYRPLLSYDSTVNKPVYDDTYKDVLNDILRRFDDYEDQFANNEEDDI